MLETVLTSGADGLGISLPTGAVGSFRAYHDFLYQKNAVMDLTAVAPEDDAARMHFLDSLALLPYIPDGSSICDIGSGAGFPGLPIRLAKPDVKLTLIDANGKRTGFLSELCPVCGVHDAKVVTGRAEELSLKPEFRDAYDVCVSRAVARLNMLCELCLPFVKAGGLFLAMKAGSCGEELDEAGRAISLLGAHLEPLVTYPIPGTELTRTLIRIRKDSPTPKGYPRRFAKIKAKPL